MPQDVIAIICDCDGTLCPDTTDRLVRNMGLESGDFWLRANGLVSEGWDPPLAYMNRLLEESRQPHVKSLSMEVIKETGGGVQFYPGALEFIPRLQDSIAGHAEYREAGIAIEWYIVSAGIESVLRATRLPELAKDIFAGDFDYDPEGHAVAVKRAVTFTEKTKFIYAINKGISGEELRRNPYRVNDAMKPEERRVPFEQMIYLGDGPSDIPCFSMIRYQGGKGIGIFPPEDTELKKPYELADGNRITVGPYRADFREGRDLHEMLARMVTNMADSIVMRRAQKVKSAPSY